MMIGHLTFAGLAELIISAGIVAYFQRTDPGLLRSTAPDAPHEWPVRWEGSLSLPTARKLWLSLAILLVLTPLGILAAGNAWGEWAAHDFADPQARQQITAASGNFGPPRQAPPGLQRLSSLWTAPISRYSPAWIRSPSFGYLVSAMVGVGTIILGSLLVNWLVPDTPRRRRKNFVEKTARHLLQCHTARAFRGRRGPVGRSLAGPGCPGQVSWPRGAADSGNFDASIVGARGDSVSGRDACCPVSYSDPHVDHANLGCCVVFTGLIAFPAIFLTPGDVDLSLTTGWVGPSPLKACTAPHSLFCEVKQPLRYLSL